MKVTRVVSVFSCSLKIMAFLVENLSTESLWFWSTSPTSPKIQVSKRIYTVLQWKNMTDSALTKWSNLTSPILRQTNLCASWYELNTTHNFSSISVKNAWPECNHKKISNKYICKKYTIKQPVIFKNIKVITSLPQPCKR